MKYDELNQKCRHLHQDEQKLSYHVKLYKSGTFWIAAGMTTVVLGITALAKVPIANAATEETTAIVKSAENDVSASSYQLNSENTAQTTTATTSAVTEATTASDSTDDSASTAKTATGDAAETATKVTNLGDASNTQIDQAKAIASDVYAQTGQPQVVTAVEPQVAATGEITIKYVDEDDPTAVLSFDRDKAGFPATAPATITGSYKATTTVNPDLVTQMKVKNTYAQPVILGYTFDKLADGDTLNFAPVADGKTITAYYKNASVTATTSEPGTTETETTQEKTVTGQVTIKYVDEDDPTAVLSFDRDKAGFPATAPATITGSYEATTTVGTDLVTQMKVKDSYTRPAIDGYTFDKLADGDTLNFAPVADGKIITAYYKNNAATSTTTGPTTTETQTTPEQTVTGQVTISYIDKDTQQPLKFNSGYSSIPGDPTQINGTYLAETKVPTAKLDQISVSSKVAQAEIVGYKFVGNDTTDLTFVPVGQEKTIRAYYEKLAPVVINYVNEADPTDVMFQIKYDTQDPAGWISGSADYNFDYEPMFNGYTYDEQKTQAESALKGNGFKSIDETDGQPVVINVYYMKTTSDPNPGAMYIDQPITAANTPINVTDKITGMTTSGTEFSHEKLPEVSTAQPISGEVVKMNGHAVNQYPNYTLTGTIGINYQDGNLSQGLMPLADYMPNQPVEVIFLDDSTGQIIQQESYGDFDPENGILPSGEYDTGVVNQAIQPQLSEKGYELASVSGNPTGRYDAMHRIVYYVYTPKLDTNYIPVTRLINFTSSDGALNINPVAQTVWYKKVTNEVTNQSTYTPQSGFYQYEIPILSGYSATIDGQPATVVAQEGLPATTGMPTNQSVTVVYAKLPSVAVPPVTGEGTPPNDDTTVVTTDNQVPMLPAEKGDKPTGGTDTTNGDAEPKTSRDADQTDKTPATKAVQESQDTSNQTTQMSDTGSSSTTTGQLPQTSETNDGVFGLLGAVLMSMLGLLGIKNKRRDE
ncbi:KxYKxGKxW signal peptide domain-containing protein [Lactobacillus sp. LC28-10]|uniref:KxYKxGKxW signal peptide domain-containing protein n=1 Tax=Secundilactobacillus angelensis TaxID=2722706 RepID=A0ABX1KYR4_9LACO|nr:KxYKxGKxW signal peptide domain-containing protein [Secundilactobacillus angelensis]MCH5462755.1 KxYKxGKxW signal peptide domain-containing protein [Secundilactobacillus angelensis]NLR19091.1 KxYKxGKxW signal peptide domain-containing protein [Secundilactobacillus angelensis]